ncbi:MAG TPA: kelch repeat-containing protein [Chthoniobacterales bacterium]|jgi:N-acetylneuraminic acid mutarotase|nr:kelch repeat-containing protein [Chthoniobacterales bacterium]
MFPSQPKAFVRLLPLPIIFFLSSLVAGFLAPRCDGRSVGFEDTGSLLQKRTNHTATLLQDGTVLVTGGSKDFSPGGGNDLTSCEIYDPATRTWTSTGNMANPRHEHTATLLPNGKVLVVGGAVDYLDDWATAELYDPATGTWTPTGSLNVSRRAHTATLLPGGKVLVAGGLHGGLTSGYDALSTAEIYDPATGTWTLTGSMAQARGHHAATLLSNGKVLVVGGLPTFSGAGNPPIKSAEIYDPASGAWTTTGSLNTGRWSHTATVLPDGRVLAAGGFGDGAVLMSAEVYDPAAAIWIPTSNLSVGRAEHTATLLPNNKVLVAGGYPAGSEGGGSTASAELYDPATGTWTRTGSLITSRREHTATLLPNGTVLIAAGLKQTNALTYLAAAELYVEATPTLLNISTRLNVQTGEKVLIGGFIITGTEQKTVVVRGIGPSLPVPGALANPVLEVYSSDGVLRGSNDNWRDAETRQQIEDSGLAPGNELESALWGVINPGAYTVILSGKDGGTGVGSVEVYDLDEPADSRLANISTRGFVDTGDNVMIAGLIVGGGSPFGTANIVVRALGPSIPVANRLANPTVELRDENGAVIVFNDDWKFRSDGSSQEAEIQATRIAPRNDSESAFVKRLGAGKYTAIVRGKDNTTGVGLVEAYHLQ